jgi:hypothetical protein
MKLNGKLAVTVTATLLVAILAFAGKRSSEVLWLDFDMKDIPEPKERSSDYYDAFFKGQVIEKAKQRTDVPRWIRLAVGHPKRASNVNAVDEVPDSSWYTNRHHIHRMSTAELQRGPNRGPGPDFSSALITKAKPSGVTPGMMLKDANGQSYLVKFDEANYPNQLSGAEIISTKILYAAGYNVPENYIAYLDPKNLKIGDDVEIADSDTKQKRPLSQEDLDRMLRGAARAADGRYRVMASKVLPGTPKGPFTQVGLRTDDPNDLIPHEHRRELRALRLISSWINNWDLKEAQSLDVYVEEKGRKFLRHYLLDFGSSLGANDEPTEYYHGHEYGFDVGSIAKEIFSLGLYESANEKRALIISPEAGNFTAAEFDPGSWKPNFPSVMFDNMDDYDAFWATRVILSFTEEDLSAIVETAEFTGLTTNNYMLQTLLDRRKMVARYWLGKVDGLSEFSIRQAADGVALTFKDLMVDYNFAAGHSTDYTYQIKGGSYKSAKKSTYLHDINIDRETLGAAVEHGLKDSPVEISIWTHRFDFTSEPVRIYFDWSPNRDTFAIRRIARG